MAEAVDTSIAQRTTEAPKFVREKVENNHGVPIVVIYVNHGGLEHPFPQRLLTEKELGEEFGNHPPALCIDSLGSVEVTDLEGAKNVLPESRNIFQWATQFAHGARVPLVGADPYSNTKDRSSGALAGLIFQEGLTNIVNLYFDSFKSTDITKDPEYMAIRGQIDNLFTTESLVNAAGGVLMGVKTIIFLMEESKKLTTPMSRRNFLRFVIGSLVGIGSAKTVLSNEGSKLEERSTELIKKKMPTEQGSIDKAIEFANEDRVINERDSKTQLFLARSRLNAAYKVILELRNLWIADGLDQDRETLMPWFKDGNMGIANIMGADHFFVDGQYNIAWLIQHREERWKLMSTLLNSFKGGGDKKDGDKVYHELVSELKKGGVTSFMPDVDRNEVEVHRFQYPFMETVK